jgi:hypothetical protein
MLCHTRGGAAVRPAHVVLGQAGGHWHLPHVPGWASSGRGNTRWCSAAGSVDAVPSPAPGGGSKAGKGGGGGGGGKAVEVAVTPKSVDFSRCGCFGGMENTQACRCMLWAARAAAGLVTEGQSEGLFWLSRPHPFAQVVPGRRARGGAGRLWARAWHDGDPALRLRRLVRSCTVLCSFLLLAK